jgi:hypothetical protein
VRRPGEILKTLDVEGTVDRQPFMPEMAEFCGKRFKVSQKMLKTCCFGTRSTIRRFRQNDVVLLDGLRCSGAPPMTDVRRRAMFFGARLGFGKWIFLLFLKQAIPRAIVAFYHASKCYPVRRLIFVRQANCCRRCFRFGFLAAGWIWRTSRSIPNTTRWASRQDQT